MLSVTKLQSSKEMLILKEIEISPVVNTVVSIVKNQYKDREFEVDINSKTPTILVDRDKFMQIMTNLIENAAKYSDEHSTVRIKSGFAKIVNLFP